MTTEPLAPPTAVARQFVRLILGFSLGVGLGLAPFLGNREVPGFEALLGLYPTHHREMLVPLGAFTMGVLAVVVQFYSVENVSRVTIRRFFRRTLAAIGAALVLLTFISVRYVEPVKTARGIDRFILVGERLPKCPCDQDTEVHFSNLHCLLLLGDDRGAIAQCWSEDAEKNVVLVLVPSYLLLTGGFGALIGLLILQNTARRQEAARERARLEKRRQQKPAPRKPAGRKPAARRPRRARQPAAGEVAPVRKPRARSKRQSPAEDPGGPPDPAD